MNDRAIVILDEYDFQVQRTWKGRGAILCETDKGIYILKEYKGSKEKLQLQNRLLQRMKSRGICNVEQIFPNKEDTLYCEDQDGICYIVKSYADGKECSSRDQKEILSAVHMLSSLQEAMKVPELAMEMELEELPVLHEFEKHTRELRHIRKYLKNKRQKTDFEVYLQNNFDYFLEKAVSVTEELSAYSVSQWKSGLKQDGTFCHGDFQYHNILDQNGELFLINFEKFCIDDPVRDLYLFSRKILEKNNWDKQLGEQIIKEYTREKELCISSRIQLLYRFLYPEKFWKICNYYYNSTKSFIPNKNMEKLDKVLEQEERKEEFVEQVLRNLSV